jgi:phosphatidylglycerophosphate synthase
MKPQHVGKKIFQTNPKASTIRPMSTHDAVTTDLPEEGGDFQTLREQGHRPGIGKAIGMGFAVTRDLLARGLVRLGVSPNHLSFAGFGFTLAAAACYVAGGSHALIGPADGTVPVSWWPLWAAIFIFLASAGDMLDGAVARVGKIKTPFGAVLDSTLDRFSDVSMFAGLALHFAMIGNLTYTMLAIIALSNTFLISYVKARAEDIIDDCSVGFWGRGERNAGFLIASFAGHLPGFLWLLAVATAFTVFRRVDYARAVLRRQTTGPQPLKGPFEDWRRPLAPWRFPRGSKPYDFVAACCIAFILFAPWIWPFFYGTTDPLATILTAVGLPVPK